MRNNTVLCVLVIALLAAQAHADLYYLYQTDPLQPPGTPLLVNKKPVGTSVGIGDAWFSSTDLQSTGTGVLRPFLKMQSNDPVEAGYNTDAKKVLNNVDSWTSSLRLGWLADVMSPTDEVSKQFLLDFDHTGTQPPFMQVTELEIRVGSNLAHYAGSWPPSGSSLVYDLHTTDPDAVLQLDYRLDPGSGGGDMWVYIPSALFAGFSPNTNVLLYSKFNNNNDGPEEWAVTMGPGVVIPLPGAVVLGLLGLGAAGMRLRRFV